MRFPLAIAASVGVALLLSKDAERSQSAVGPLADASQNTSATADAVGPLFDDDAAMAPHARPVASYTLQASLDPQRHTIVGRGTMVWVNASRIPQREVFVHLYLNAFKNDRTVFLRAPGTQGEGFRGAGALTDFGYIRVTRFAVAGGADLWPTADKTTPGHPDDETDIRVPLPEPVEPGASISIDLAWESHLPSLVLRTGHAGDFQMAGQWFPKIARLTPDGRWAHFPFHHLSEFYADFGTYDVTIDTPEATVVGATGRPSGEVRAGGRVSRRFVQEDVHDFAFAAWDKFEELTALTQSGVAVRILFPPGYERAARAELDTVSFGLPFFGKAFGKYPYGTLTIVHPPAFAEEAGGMEYPTLITTGGPWYAPYTGVRITDLVTIHELAHQWFYGLVATDEHRFPFLDEGITSYAEALAMEHRFPDASAAGAFGLSISLLATNRIASASVATNGPVARPAAEFVTGKDYGSLVYARTATILATLGRVYGDEKLARTIGRYARRYRFEHPGPEEFLSVVREGMGGDAEQQLRAALFDCATVDYSIADISSAPDTGARGLRGEPPVALPERPVDGKGYQGTALVRRRGALHFPVDVALIGADGQEQRVRWTAQEMAASIPYVGTSPLVAAVVDPDHRVLLDDDLSNNSLRVSPHFVSGTVLELLTFAIEAGIASLLP